MLDFKPWHLIWTQDILQIRNSTAEPHRFVLADIFCYMTNYQSVLCISNSKRVFHMLFAGQNPYFVLKQIFSSLTEENKEFSSGSSHSGLDR